MTVHSLEDLVRFARAHSPFYREFLADVPERGFSVTDLPVLDQKAYWEANVVGKGNRVLTGPIADGIVFKSGGTTGNPKFSVFTDQEWESFTETFGWGMRKGGLEPGEKVANLFYAGELYASFLFITSSLEAAGAGVNYPISGATDLEEILEFLDLFGIETLAGVPTTIMKVGEAVLHHGNPLPSVQRIVFGGESMYPDQREMLGRAFPGARIQSIGYASVDGGELGYADADCAPDEHRAFHTTILELVDEETGEAIEEEGAPGKIVVTNLTRRLMPIIRYPAGDRAVWVEPPGTPDRKYRLLGRSEEGARVGPMTLYIQDVWKVLSAFHDRVPMANFQIRITHEEMKDRGTLRLVPEDPERATEELAAEIVRAVYEERPMFGELLENGLVHPLTVEWISFEELLVNERTGKLRRIIDERAP